MQKKHLLSKFPFVLRDLQNKTLLIPKPVGKEPKINVLKKEAKLSLFFNKKQAYVPKPVSTIKKVVYAPPTVKKVVQFNQTKHKPVV